MYVLSNMARKAQILFPLGEQQFSALGERLRLARLRRGITMMQMAQRAGITRATLYRAEAGDPGASLGVYFNLLRVLGLQADLDKVAADDALGRKLQDMELPERRHRTSKDQP